MTLMNGVLAYLPDIKADDADFGTIVHKKATHA
jgi:hypothetical protein